MIPIWCLNKNHHHRSYNYLHASIFNFLEVKLWYRFIGWYCLMLRSRDESFCRPTSNTSIADHTLVSYSRPTRLTMILIIDYDSDTISFSSRRALWRQIKIAMADSPLYYYFFFLSFKNCKHLLREGIGHACLASVERGYWP